jgi:hypothetical protein
MPKRVSHIKTARAKVRIHFRGKHMELVVVLPREIEKQLATRLNREKRFPPKREQK